MQGFDKVWELLVSICTQDRECVREEDHMLAFMIWSLNNGGSLHVGFRFCTIVGTVLSDGNPWCGFLSSWEVDNYFCPSVGSCVSCGSICKYMDPCFLSVSLRSYSQGEGLLHRVILCVSTREGRDCGMGVDVSYVRYSGLWHVWREEGACPGAVCLETDGSAFRLDVM